MSDRRFITYEFSPGRFVPGEIVASQIGRYSREWRRVMVYWPDINRQSEISSESPFIGGLYASLDDAEDAISKGFAS